MRVTPVSGDLLVKLAVVIGGAALAVWAVGRVRQAAADSVTNLWASIANGAEQAINWAGNAAQAVNPASDQNLLYQGLSRGLGGESLGGWLYNEVHFENHPEYEFMGPPNIYAGQGNYTSVTPAYNGPGGAAFGMYPRINTGGATGSW